MQVKRYEYGTTINFYSNDGEFLNLWIESDGRICDGKTTNNLDHWRNKEEADKFLREWLPQSGWLDTKAVEIAANRSDMCALLSSITHWRQIVVNWDNYKQAMFDGKVGTHAGYCALCQRHLSSRTCPLLIGCHGPCINEWRNFQENPTLDNAIAMHNRLVVLLNQEVEAKSNIVEFKPGDVVKGEWGVRLIVRIKNKLHAVGKFGCVCATGQAQFEELNYEKIGTCNEFIIK